MLDRPAEGAQDKAAPSLEHMQSGRARAAVAGSFWSTVNFLVPALVAAVVFAITSRHLSPTDFGLVSFAATITMIGSALGPGGLGEALIQRKAIDDRHLNAVFWACVASGALLTVAIVLAAPLIASAFADERLTGLTALLALRILFDMAAIVPNALLVRQMSFGRLALRTTLASLISGGVCLALLFAGYGLWALAVSQLATSVSIAAGSILSVKWRPGLSFDRIALRDVQGYGLFATGQRIVQMINFDQLLIGALAGTYALGIFSFAKRIHLLLSDMIGGGLRLVSFSVLSSMQSEPEKLRQAYLFATFLSSAVSFPLFCGLAAIANDAIPLVFGAHWLEAVPTLQAFCLLGLVASIGLLQSALINSQGNAAWWFYYQVVQQALTVLTVLVTFPFGITTVTVALVAKTLILWPVTVAKTLRLLDMKAGTYAKSFLWPTVASAIMVLVVFYVRNALPGDAPVARLLVEIAAGAASYLAILCILELGRLRQFAGMVITRKS
ncbi:MAG: lipopolysaccharide biosynthesis protein [Rhizobiaceae bacterium]|nr:lipopolysaccharide biosynthesis protein [Rhizobiaceae bacterium]